jgi:hypothetical protein
MPAAGELTYSSMVGAGLEKKLGLSLFSEQLLRMAITVPSFSCQPTGLEDMDSEFFHR